MSLKGSTTTTTYLEWNDFISLITRLEKDENYNLTVFDVLMPESNNSAVNLGVDKISSIAYDSRGRSLVAGTK